MKSLNCLSQLEPPYQFYSILNIANSGSTRFCILAEGYFNIYRDQNDFISVCRVPLNKNTKLEFALEKFTISCSKFSFSYYHQSMDIMSQWRNVLMEAIQSEPKEVDKDSEMEMIKIEKIVEEWCPVVFSCSSCRLLIYESWDHLSVNICRHVINLKSHTNINFHDNFILVTRNETYEYKMEFKNPFLAKKWAKNFRKSIEYYASGLWKIYDNVSNRKCADCGALDPKFVSINLCITICYNCMLAHKNLGTIISKPEYAVLNRTFPDAAMFVKLLNQVGNENANKFWYKSKSSGNLSDTFFKRKYIKKEFADPTYSSLCNDTIIEKLQGSVRTDDVLETMMLWFSYKGLFSRDTVNKLQIEARDSGQKIQKTFISLQENVNDDSDTFLRAIFTGSLQMLINKKHKPYCCNQVCIYKDSITMTANSRSDVCTIFTNFITMVTWNKSQKSIEIFVTDKCSVWKRNSLLGVPIFVNNVTVKDHDGSSSFVNFKESLMNSLLRDSLKPPTDDTTLFFITEVEINSKQRLTYKCHVTKHELTLEYPDFQNYDLTRSHELKLSSDCQSVLIRISDDDIVLRLGGHCQVVFKYLVEASKVSLLSLYDVRTVMKIQILIDFIRDNGLTTEGIFRLSGRTKVIESLFEKVHKARIYFLVDQNSYSVHDAVSCLKKCLQCYLDEDLIPAHVYMTLVAVIDAPEKDGAKSACRNAVLKLLDVNYRILRRVVELFFMIVQMTEFNKMDSNNLSIAAAQSVFANTEKSLVTNCEILTFLIENFEFIFDYSVDEQITMLARINQYKKEVCHKF